MIPRTISIIGGRGKMGSLFADSFRSLGYDVLISDERNTNNLELAKQGGVVIVSVPIEKTELVIEEIGPYVRKDALLTDFTSVKMKPIAAMLKYSEAEIIGGHPLFGPGIDSLRGQNMVLCPERRGDYFSWYKNTLELLGLNVSVMTSEEHDKTMAVMQCLTHLSNLTFAYALTKMSADIQPEATTPAFLLRLYAAKRMLSLEHSLYAGILSENPFGGETVRRYLETVAEVCVINKDSLGKEKKKLEELLRSLQREFENLPYCWNKKVHFE